MEAGGPPPRRSPGRPAVPLDRILSTAVAIVDQDGADALTMRSLAQKLHSGTATLYRHFSGRTELAAMVVDRLLGEGPFDAEAVAAMPWREAYAAIANHAFQALSRHGNVGSLLIGNVAIGPNALKLRETCLSVLLNSGFSGQDAARGFATMARFVVGMAIQTPASDARAAADDAAAAQVFQQLDPGDFPSTVALSDSLPVSVEDEFAFGLRLLIDGLACLRASHADARPSSGRGSS